MGRPLTAADRLPEVGDVLTNGKRHARVFKIPETGGVLAFVNVLEEDGKEERIGWIFRGAAKANVYVSRRDGGTTTTDEP